jgi:MFS family permease
MTHPTPPPTPNDDDMMALWKADPNQPDPSQLIASVRASDRQQRRYLQASCAFGALALVYIGWLDLQGVFRWPGLMTAFIVLSFAWTLWKAQRDRKRCPPLATLAPIELLRLALRHARAGLRNARMSHTGVPLGVVCGMLIGPFLVVEGADAGEPTWVTVLWIAAALAFVMGFIVYGLRLARRKKAEIKALEARLREFEETS